MLLESLLFLTLQQAMPLAQPVPLADVRLLPSPFETARTANARYLLSLDVGRLMHRFHKFAGMEPKGAEYGGWEKDTISGHSLGHHLSAVAMEYASTGNPKFKERVEEVVRELKAVQDKHGNGYVAGLPEHERLWAEIERGEIRSRGFDLNGLWVPWYNLHKTFAGLLDAHALAGNAEALEVAKKLADWSIHITRNLDEAKWQQMLACEFGGMNESLAELYARTGKKKYLELAEKFYHKAILDPLAEGKDILPGKHGNTQIPKIIGIARLYELTGNPKYRKIAEFFWDTVVNHHMYAIGGITSGEYFGEPDKLSDRLTGNTCEVCKTYNMLKLTWKLFSWQPHAKYADYAERALYNHILASQNPKDGMFCYFTGLMPGSKKNFSTPTDSFWCCVGSGMENHAKYGEGVYFKTKDALYVNLYIPSTVVWKEEGLSIKQESIHPLDSPVFTVTEATSTKAASIFFRQPHWSSGMTLSLNGDPAGGPVGQNGYQAIHRIWKVGDKVTVGLRPFVRRESMPDNPRRVAYFDGPLVLAADLSAPASPWDSGRMPVVIQESGQPQLPTSTAIPRGHYVASSGKPHVWALRPLYEIIHQPYSVYFDLFTEEEWKAEETRYRELERQRLELEKRTVDWFAIGQMQPERDHKLTGEKTYTGDFAGKHYRDARDGGFFEFELKVDPAADQELIFTYWGGDQGRTFDILLNGEKLMTQRLQNSAPGKFFDVAASVPATVKGKSSIKIRFQAPARGMAGGVFGVRVIRKA